MGNNLDLEDLQEPTMTVAPNKAGNAREVKAFKDARGEVHKTEVAAVRADIGAILLDCDVDSDDVDRIIDGLFKKRHAMLALVTGLNELYSVTGRR